jgi:hypothetical protein
LRNFTQTGPPRFKKVIFSNDFFNLAPFFGHNV